MSCPRCLARPTDGQCCPEPIRYWRHSDAGQDIQFASAVVPMAPVWCAVHRWASDRPCTVCVPLGAQMELCA